MKRESKSRPMDELFRALANAQRRRLLVALLDHNPQRDTVDVPEDVEESKVMVETRQAEFFHTHLPSLEDSGFIRWNRESHEVVKGPRFDEIRPVLELIEAHADELPTDRT